MIGPVKNKLPISKYEWLEKLNETQVPKEHLNKLIMNFFSVEGFHITIQQYDQFNKK